MAKQDDTLASVMNAIGEGADKAKDTVRDLGEKAKEVKAGVEKKTKAAARTVKDVAAKTRKRAAKTVKTAEAEVKEGAENVENAVEKTAKKLGKEEKSIVKRGRKPKALKALEEAVEKKTAKKEKPAKTKLIFQFYGNNVDADEVMKKAEKAAKKAVKGKSVKTLEVYINGHENAAYYVVNGEGKKEYRIDL